jgi:hypothetical protein
VLLLSTDPLVHDASGDNDQVATRNFSSQHTARAVSNKISTKTKIKHQIFNAFSYLHFGSIPAPAFWLEVFMIIKHSPTIIRQSSCNPSTRDGDTSVLIGVVLSFRKQMLMGKKIA